MALTAGSIAFVGMNTAGSPDDWVAFAALADIPSGTVIYFSDNEISPATATVFNTGESYSKWTAPAGGVPAGTVVTLTNFDISGGPVANVGTAAVVTFSGSTNRGFSQTTDSLYAYLAASDATANTPTTHLARINLGNAEDGVVPSTLPESSAISFVSGQESAFYTGPRTGLGSFAAYAAAIDNPANWTLTVGSTASSALNTALFIVTQPATISIDDVTVTEGNAGTSTLTFTVTRSNNTGAFTLDYATANGTALAGSDFTGASGQVSFAVGGALTQTISVTINGDTSFEDTESFVVNLSNVVSTTGSASFADAQGTGTITNDDTLTYNYIYRTTHAGQTLTGTASNDWVYGGNGNDTIAAGGAADRVYAGAGDDIVRSGAGADILYGEAGNDTADYSDAAGAVFVDLAARFANETALSVGTVSGAAAIVSTDTLISFENVTGSAFGDRLYGTTGDNVFQTGAGSDIVYGLDGSDTISYVAAAGAVFVDLAAGLAKETALTTGTVSGATSGISADSLISLENARGSAFGDRLYGTSDANQIFGEGGDDFIYGIGGNDTIVGGAGDDRLVGGDGVDTLTGGEGADRFYFVGNEIGGADVIADFVSGTDDIYLSLANFNGAAAFLAGTGTTDEIFGAHTAAGLAYDTANNVLYYDADGSAGVASAIAIASFTAPVGGVTGADVVFY